VDDVTSYFHIIGHIQANIITSHKFSTYSPEGTTKFSALIVAATDNDDYVNDC